MTREYSAVSNIKDRVNRKSVEDSIISIQQKLKLYKCIPQNGLVIYAGINSDEKRILIDFEPYKPLKTSIYKCDSVFHTEFLDYLFTDDSAYGFIIIDGESTLLGIVKGTDKKILYEYKVSLPNKQGRGGQSQNRFQRIREEKRKNYITKVCEFIHKYYINDDKVNVENFVLAGSAELKNELYNSSSLDPRIKNKIICLIDTCYGSINGFNQAILESKEMLSNTKLKKEIELLSDFFNEINKETLMVSYGRRDTITALEAGCCKILILSEKYPEDEIEELIQKYSDKTIIKIISDTTTEGTQFYKGFGGIGSILRYQYNFEHSNDYDYDYEFDNEFDNDFI